MASTLVFVSHPDFPAAQFDRLLDAAAAAGLFNAADQRRGVSDGRQVAKSPAPDGDIEALRTAASDLLSANGVDESQICAAVIPESITNAQRLLLLMDVDSTLIKQEVIELLAAHAGREAEVAAVTEAAMRGELDFAQSLIGRVATLKDLPDSVLAQVGERIEFSDGAEDLVRRFHRAGHKVAVVSGGFQQILNPLAAHLKLDHALANTLGITDGVLDGTVHGTIVDRAMKEQMLRTWSAEHGIELNATIAAGDGANDLDMVNAAGLGVAFNAKPALREKAAARIDFSRLDVIADLVLEDMFGEN